MLNGTPCDYHPCQNGGTCKHLQGNSYQCQCNGKYSGHNCTQAINGRDIFLLLLIVIWFDPSDAQKSSHKQHSFEGQHCEEFIPDVFMVLLTFKNIVEDINTYEAYRLISMSYWFENCWALYFSNSFLAFITCQETANFAPSWSRPILDCFREVTNWRRKGILRLSLKSIFRSTDSEDFRGISVTPVKARGFERTIYNIFNKRDIESRLDCLQN